MHKLLTIFIFSLILIGCAKKIPPCEPSMKFNTSADPLKEIIAGASDSLTIFTEVYDSTEILNKSYITLDSGNTSCGIFLRIKDAINGLGHISIEKGMSELTFCVGDYVDSTFKKEYVQTWATKRDSVTMYTSYNQDGAELHEVNTNQYVKTFSSGEMITAAETFAPIPLPIFERTNRSKLYEPVVVDGIYVFEKEIFDLKTQHIIYNEPFYIGFKYETENTLQIGYIHLEIFEEETYDGTDVFFYVHDWGIRVG